MLASSRRTRTPRADYDGFWKEGLGLFFQSFLVLCFPGVAALIDWSQPVEYLDTEMRRALRGLSRRRRNQVDRLVKVHLLDGGEQWILIHVEVQSQWVQDFPERIFRYLCRLFDRLGHKVIPLVVYGDTNPNWRPDHFGYSFAGLGPHLTFGVMKILDWEARWADLEASTSPFAPLLQAHLRTLRSQHQVAARFRWKVELVQGLYRRGLSADQVQQLFRLVDWVMALPEEWETRFDAEVRELEEGTSMPVISHIERTAEARGKLEGKLEALQQAVLVALSARFASVPESLTRQITGATVADWLPLVREAAVTPSLEAFEQALRGALNRSRL